MNAASTSDDLSAHYRLVAQALADGRAVPFLGAGVNLCGRPEGAAWSMGRFLPSATELADYLAESLGYPSKDGRELLRVSQYISVMTGSGPLYTKLRDLFDVDYPPTKLHEFLAALPALFAVKGLPERASNPLLVTTNYDDMLERAYAAAGVAYDVVTYIAEGEHSGKFMHILSDGSAQIVDKPNEYRGIPLTKRPVILKIHGAIDRRDGDNDSYVITEDHYIEYLSRTDISSLLPIQIAAKLKQSHFLFLGYSLSDWNLRVILHRIWGQQRLTWNSWAIQRNSHELDRKFWLMRGVEILDVDLETYVTDLERHLAPPLESKTP
jgi:hypothetical protein